MRDRPPTTLRTALVRLAWRAAVVIYLVALLISHLSTPGPDRAQRASESRFNEITYTTSRAEPQSFRIASRLFGAWDNPEETRPPVVLLHGCPGAATDFNRLAPVLASDGRRVIAVDLPGFGDSRGVVSDYSMQSNARAVLALLDARSITRAHLVGWSNSGGVVLHAAHERPELVASITMLAAVGDQRYEGSGSYAVEHAKYALGLVAGVWLPEFVPHFGALGERDWRRACLRFFFDSDQRPLAEMMSNLKTPALVLHGRDDFLVPLRAAERHHELLASSRLVVLDASHFIPFTHVLDGAKAVTAFIGDVESGTAIAHARTDPPARAPPVGPARAVAPLRSLAVASPWWAHVLVIAALAALAPTPALVIACALVVGLDVDWFVALMAFTLGRAIVFARRARRADRNGQSAYWKLALPRGAARAGIDASAESSTSARDAVRVWTSGAPRVERIYYLAGLLIGRTGRLLISFLTAWIACAALLPSDGATAQWWRAAPGALGASLITWALPLALSRAGRARLRTSIGRAMHHEYWPAWAYYPPVMAWMIFCAARRGGPLVPCACNPGIANGGGVVGESKSAIMDAMRGQPEILDTLLIAPGEPARRAAELARHGRPYPLILKPDEGQRGYALKLVRSDAQALEYFSSMTGGAVAQPFHPGPHECGVFWMRSLGPRAELLDRGEIFSITRKTFPTVVGDGVRTVEQLVAAHPRHSRQRDLFYERLGPRRSDIPGAREVVALAVSGNHCQGTLFRDGADLITPELNAAISRLALSFKGGFDCGRFDIRFESDDMLRRGEGFAVIELNGITSESTNCYDPQRSVLWSWGVLMKQWSRVYALGAARVRAGGRVPRVIEVVGMLRDHYRGRTGNAVAD